MAVVVRQQAALAQVASAPWFPLWLDVRTHVRFDVRFDVWGYVGLLFLAMVPSLWLRF